MERGGRSEVWRKKYGIGERRGKADSNKSRNKRHEVKGGRRGRKNRREGREESKKHTGGKEGVKEKRSKKDGVGRGRYRGVKKGEEEEEQTE